MARPGLMNQGAVTDRTAADRGLSLYLPPFLFATNRKGQEMTIQELREARAKKVEEATAFSNDAANWTAEKREASNKAFASMKAEITAFDQDIERDDAIREMAAKSQAKADSLPNAASSVSVGADREAKKPFAYISEQLRAIYKAGQPNGSVDKRLMEINATAGTGNKESVSEEGGFLVQKDFAIELLSMADEDSNNTLVKAASKRTISNPSNGIEIDGLDETSRANGSRYGGIRVYTAAELEQMTESRTKVCKISLKLSKLTGLYYASDEIIQDVAFIQSEVDDLFRKEFGFKVQDLIFRGSGAGEPLGVLNAPCTISVAKESGQSAQTIVTENIDKMWNRMPASLRPQAIWVANQDIEPALESMVKVVGTGGVPAYMPAGGISETQYSRLKGRPLYFIEHCETLGTSGDIMLLAMNPYIWATKGGIETAMSIHLKFDLNQTAFRWTVRVDGQPRWKSALSPYKGSTTVSPFIKLATRS
jgi:HK97 family phage major capsid protein